MIYCGLWSGVMVQPDAPMASWFDNDAVEVGYTNLFLTMISAFEAAFGAEMDERVVPVETNLQAVDSSGPDKIHARRDPSSLTYLHGKSRKADIAGYWVCDNNQPSEYGEGIVLPFGRTIFDGQSSRIYYANQEGYTVPAGLTMETDPGLTKVYDDGVVISSGVQAICRTAIDRSLDYAVAYRQACAGMIGSDGQELTLGFYEGGWALSACAPDEPGASLMNDFTNKLLGSEDAYFADLYNYQELERRCGPTQFMTFGGPSGSPLNPGRWGRTTVAGSDWKMFLSDWQKQATAGRLKAARSYVFGRFSYTPDLTLSQTAAITDAETYADCPLPTGALSSADIFGAALVGAVEAAPGCFDQSGFCWTNLQDATAPLTTRENRYAIPESLQSPMSYSATALAGKPGVLVGRQHIGYFAEQASPPDDAGIPTGACVVLLQPQDLEATNWFAAIGNTGLRTEGGNLDAVSAGVCDLGVIAELTVGQPCLLSLLLHDDGLLRVRYNGKTIIEQKNPQFLQQGTLSMGGLNVGPNAAVGGFYAAKGNVNITRVIQAEGRLASINGQQALLPDNHPYKETAP